MGESETLFSFGGTDPKCRPNFPVECRSFSAAAAAGVCRLKRPLEVETSPQFLPLLDCEGRETVRLAVAVVEVVAVAVAVDIAAAGIAAEVAAVAIVEVAAADVAVEVAAAEIAAVEVAVVEAAAVEVAADFAVVDVGRIPG